MIGRQTLPLVSAESAVSHVRALRSALFALLAAIRHPVASTVGEQQRPRDAMNRLVHQIASVPLPTRDSVAGKVSSLIYGNAVAALVDDLAAAGEDFLRLLDVGPAVCDDDMISNALEIPQAARELRNAVRALVQGVGVRIIPADTPRGSSPRSLPYADTGEACGLDETVCQVERLLAQHSAHTGAERAIAACRAFVSANDVSAVVLATVAAFRTGRRDLLGIDDDEDDDGDECECDEDIDSEPEEGSPPKRARLD